MKLLLSLILCLCAGCTAIVNNEPIKPGYPALIPFNTTGVINPTQVNDWVRMTRIMQENRTYRSVNGLFLGTGADSVKWVTTGHTYLARFEVYDNAFTTYFDLGQLTFKPLQSGGFSDSIIVSVIVVKESQQVQPYKLHISRVQDTLFIDRGFLFTGWAPLQVWGRDTMIWVK